MKQFYYRSVQRCLDQGYIPKTINRILKQGVSRLHTLRDDDLTVEKVQAGRPRERWPPRVQIYAYMNDNVLINPTARHWNCPTFEALQSLLPATGPGGSRRARTTPGAENAMGT